MTGAPASLNELIMLYSGLLYGAGGSYKSGSIALWVQLFCVGIVLLIVMFGTAMHYIYLKKCYRNPQLGELMSCQ